jgi:hypothetical protein
MNPEDIRLREQARPRRVTTPIRDLEESDSETQSRMVATRAGGEGCQIGFNRDRISTGKTTEL